MNINKQNMDRIVIVGTVVISYNTSHIQPQAQDGYYHW